MSKHAVAAEARASGHCDADSRDSRSLFEAARPNVAHAQTSRSERPVRPRNRRRARLYAARASSRGCAAAARMSLPTAPSQHTSLNSLVLSHVVTETRSQRPRRRLRLPKPLQPRRRGSRDVLHRPEARRPRADAAAPDTIGGAAGLALSWPQGALQLDAAAPTSLRRRRTDVAAAPPRRRATVVIAPP